MYLRIKLWWCSFIKFIVTTELYVDVGTGDCVCLIDYNGGAMVCMAL